MSTDRPDPAEAAASLRAVLAAVDAGEVSAGPDQAAWLRGAADVLELLASGLGGRQRGVDRRSS